MSMRTQALEHDIIGKIMENDYGIFSDALDTGFKNFLAHDDDDDSDETTSTLTIDQKAKIAEAFSNVLGAAIEGDQVIASQEEKELATLRGEFIKSLIDAGHRPNEPKKVFTAAIPSPALVEKYGLSVNANSKHPSVGSGRMAYHPGKIGILIADGRRFNSGNVSKILAQTMYALGLIPNDYTSTVCMLSGNLDEHARETYINAKESGLLDRINMEVIYDLEGRVEERKPDITDGLVWCEDEQIRFAMDKAKTTPRMNSVIYDNTIANLKSMFTLIGRKDYGFSTWGGFGSWADDEEAYPIENAIQDFSLGRSNIIERLEKEYRDNAESLIDYGLPKVRTYGGWNVKSAMESFATLRDDEACAEFDDILKIWVETLSDYGFDFSPETLRRKNKIRELAERLDIDKKLELYYEHHVPVADILG